MLEQANSQDQTLATSFAISSTKIHLEVATTSTKRGFPWDKLPFEIREQIFKEVYGGQDPRYGHSGSSKYFKWRGSMPPLVVALRPLPTSYDHVLIWFRKHNKKVFIHGWYGSALEGMITRELDVVEAVNIDLRTREKRYTLRHPKPFSSMLTRPFGTFELFNKAFLGATNVREVNLSINVDFVHASDLVHFMTEFPFWLQGFKSLEVVTIDVPLLLEMHDTTEQRELLEALMRRIHKKIGVKGELAQFSVDFFYLREEEVDGIDFQRVRGTMDRWMWKAGDGKKMDWSQDLGWEWTFSDLMVLGNGQQRTKEEI